MYVKTYIDIRLRAIPRYNRNVMSVNAGSMQWVAKFDFSFFLEYDDDDFRGEKEGKLNGMTVSRSNPVAAVASCQLPVSVCVSVRLNIGIMYLLSKSFDLQYNF